MSINRREMMTEQAERMAREALADPRSTLERALRELDRYAEQLDAAETLSEKAKVMNWVLNYLASGITPNLRLNMIANAQAELIRADMAE